jgi:hypothetical protein
MKTRAELLALITTLGVNLGSARDLQASAYQFKNSRLSRLNVDASAVLATAVVGGQVGSQFNIPIQFVPGAAQVASLQFDLLIPTGFALVSATAGPVATAAGKQVNSQFNPPGLPASTVRVLLFGLNQTVLGEGHLLTLRLSTQSSVARRRYPMGISNVIASDLNGIDAPISGLAGPVVIQ